MSILEQIWQCAIAASAWEQIATVLGVLGVWLAMRESLWNFPVGLVQVVIFGWVCFRGKLYSETVLQAFFFTALLYGWWHWKRGGTEMSPLKVTSLSGRAASSWIVGTLALWGIWGAAMARGTDAVLPFADGFVFAVSVAAQWLQSRKALEAWVGWIVANTAGIGVFWVKGFYWFAVLYFIFWLMSWSGLRAWRASMKREAAGV